MQANFPPLLGTAAAEALTAPAPEAEAELGPGGLQRAAGKHHPVLLALLAASMRCAVEDILDFELQLCDTQPAAVGGAMDEFIFSGRLDNLANCFCAGPGRPGVVKRP
jgi:aspartyl aminopeptidase